ncbi:NAD-dependent epimerase/dehydratase family protein [Haloarchaeobius sp. HME9146]|uniref:NAD-dependent epimerase/dehydratase family protein n=1 Tax=Haloarchaeobius sp. HME9146 TaxID=2978732 RepID=UPI0021BE7D97|nr:NAD-dependent epimerase/dehydratase family protein [Haloarchaeobius sp. HME9146]MCT9097224.1 NAD-dependent epimerase/dehydratase family protein [Haloarchaeobius sp. HME9146]
MQDKRVLVTGGAGFIGSNLANYLAQENDVVVVDDCYLGTPENLDDGVEFVQASVLDDDLPTEGVDALFHLAALSSLKMHEDSRENLLNGLRVNVEGFANTVEQCRQDGCDTVVYASTSSIYGNRTEPSPESMDVAANTGYEASKLARERYAEYFHNYHGLSMAGMRFFSVYQGYEGGAEEHKGEFANIVAQFADWLANDEPPVIYGDGTHTRDLTYVDDIVRGLEAAADHELTGIYNLGTGEQYSANEIVETLCTIMGKDIEPEHVENPIDEDVFVQHTMADHTKMTEATGWEPQVSFEEGMRRVCAPYLD